MKVKFSNFTTMLENDKAFNNQQRNFFKAARMHGDFHVDISAGKRTYLFAFDQADLIHIGILGILYDLPKTTKDYNESL